MRFCKVIWLINICNFNKYTTVASTATLRFLSHILISTSSAKMDRDYLTTFMMLVTLSVILSLMMIALHGKNLSSRCLNAIADLG